MFAWSKAFETGIFDIDQQHQELFRIGRDLFQKVEENPSRDISDSIMDCLENLAMYASFHFDTEESLFVKCGYYDCEAHIQEHRSFIEHLEKFDLDQIDTDQETAVRELLSFISYWIFRHISKTDFKYVPVISECIQHTG